MPVGPARRAGFVRKPWRKPQESWDHDHCTGCWAKLAEPDMAGADIQHEGYARTATETRSPDPEWVCIECFRLFREAMAWVDETPRA